MDRSLKKPCTTVLNVNNDKVLVDRLTNLPDELLIRVISLLPTKDAAATCSLSKRLRRIFPLLTSLDFDVSPISLCLKHPYAIQRFPTFVSFVDNVLQPHQSRYLTKFRLQVSSGDFLTVYFNGCIGSGCGQGSLPDLKSPQLKAWISYPFTLCGGLRELDLCILVREPGDAQLPPAIFTCETLEVLKLELNIGLDHVFAMPSYRLPNLKLLLLTVDFISDDAFLSRLVSSCPVLEDLRFTTYSNDLNIVEITSTSLRRLSLAVPKYDHPTSTEVHRDLVLINAPNLEYLDYTDDLAKYYSLPIMHRLVKALLVVIQMLDYDELSMQESFQESFQQMINLIRPMSYVQHLSLRGYLMPVFDYVDDKVLKDQLPVFPNLKHLELGRIDLNCWNKVLLPFLNCSPALETLVFEEGLNMNEVPSVFSPNIREELVLEREREFFSTDHEIPVCYRFHLKRIVIKRYFGVERDLVITKFFLRHALVLEELVIYLSRDRNAVPYQNHMSVENTLKNLPKASVTCSIQVL